jgi:hypothetical protein
MEIVLIERGDGKPLLLLRIVGRRQVLLEVERNLLFLVIDVLTFVTLLALTLRGAPNSGLWDRWTKAFEAFTLNGSPEGYGNAWATTVGIVGAVGGRYTGPTRPPGPWESSSDVSDRFSLTVMGTSVRDIPTCASAAPSIAETSPKPPSAAAEFPRVGLTEALEICLLGQGARALPSSRLAPARATCAGR